MWSFVDCCVAELRFLRNALPRSPRGAVPSGNDGLCFDRQVRVDDAARFDATPGAELRFCQPPELLGPDGYLDLVPARAER